MRNPPVDLGLERLQDELVVGWNITPRSMDYVPEGGGSHHWRAIDEGSTRHFVTVDDLDGKKWLGETRDEALAGLSAAFDTARELRNAGLGFVVAPVPARDGSLVRRLDTRYAVAVYPFHLGRSYRFGPYLDQTLRDRALDLVAELHGATSVVRDRARHNVLGFGDQRDLLDFLAEPGRPWGGGPYSEPTRLALAGHVFEIADLVAGFKQLAQRTAHARQDTVITHGEPHPANFISVSDELLLVDWDTVALAPRERDLSLIVDDQGPSVARYERATGHRVDFEVIILYRLRWYLDDLASAVRLFRRPHDDNPDTQLWWDGLTPRIEELPCWLARLADET